MPTRDGTFTAEVEVAFDSSTRSAVFSCDNGGQTVFVEGDGNVLVRWSSRLRRVELCYHLASELVEFHGLGLGVVRDELPNEAARLPFEFSFPPQENGWRGALLLTEHRPPVLPYGFEYEILIRYDGDVHRYDPKIYNEAGDQPPSA